jgi:hypothetical protein
MRKILLILILSAAIIGGLYARISGIQERPYSVDEFYMATSIQSILDNGVPDFKTGGFYTRGLLYQYISAGMIFLFETESEAYRFVSAFFGLLSIVLAYLYCRRFLNEIMATAVAITLLISSWHIEFSLFIRMYTLFQFLTLCFLISVDSAYFGDRWRLRYVPHLIALTGMFVHAMSLLLLPFLFIPLIDRRRFDRFSTRFALLCFASASVVTVLISYMYSRTGIIWSRFSGVSQSLPADFVSQPGSSLRTPHFPFWGISGNDVYNLSVPILLSAVIVAMLWLLRRIGMKVRESDYWIPPLVIFSAAHNLLVAGIVSGICLFRFRLWSIRENSLQIYFALAFSIVVAIGWIIYGMLTPNWWEGISFRSDTKFLHLIEAWQITFAGWPDLGAALYPFIRDLPYITVLFSSSVVYLAVSELRRPWAEVFRSPAFMVVYVFACIGILYTPFATSRYGFFIYPLMLCTIAMAAFKLSQYLTVRLHFLNVVGSSWLAFMLYLVAFAASLDFNPGHIRSISEDRVVYRMGGFSSFADIWYVRREIGSVVRYLDERAKNDQDEFIIVEQIPQLSHYFAEPYTTYYDRNGTQFRGISRNLGKTELWTNLPLSSTPEELRNITARSSVVLLVVRTDKEHKRINIEEIWGDRLENHSTVLVSKDGRIQIVEILLRTDKSGNTLE